MYGRAGTAIKYLVLSTGLGFALLAVAKPSEQELQKIKDFSGKTKTFSDVIKAASDPNSKPIYLRKPGEQFVPTKTLDQSTK